MFPSFTSIDFSSFRTLTESFFLSDFFDVAIIAIFIYSALILFKRTRSLTILAGISIIVVLYGISQLFHLTLTSVVLQSFFGVFFLVLIIIFQEEVRRFFDIITVWGTRQKHMGRGLAESLIIEPIVQAVVNLARHSVGAIIVFTGNENIERHISGGVILDGIISQELVESVFDPHSPGHDGAMIITKNRIVSIGAQLPLSQNLDQIEKSGTRHSAALGIAERSDALALVVSEERGTISIAQKDTMTKISTAHELARVLGDFYHEKHPQNSYTLWQRIIAQNLIEKIIAIGIAVLLWFFLVFQAGTVQRDFEIPITYRDLPQDLVIRESKQKTVAVTLGSRGQTFEQLDQSSLQISIDASRFASGQTRIPITESMVRRPFAFSVIDINPTEIEITVGHYQKHNVPLRAVTQGSVARGYRVENIIIQPRTVSLLIPESREVPASVSLNPIDITGLTSTISRSGLLSLPEGIRLGESGNLDIAVTIVIRRQ